MTSTYMVSGLKCGGATTFSLNMALLLSTNNPDLKVGCLQFEYFSDLHVYCGLERFQPISDIFEFQKTPQWNGALLPKFAHKQSGVDVFFSPQYEGTKREREKLLKLFLQTYDILVININHTKLLPWGELFQECTQRIFYLTTLSPTALQALPKGMSLFEGFSCKPEIILNQVRKGEVKKVKALFKAQKLPAPIRILPFDEDAFWQQLFKGVPPVCLKRSIWGKALRVFCNKYCSHA